MSNKPTTKMKNRGSNIADVLNINNSPDDKRAIALRRTMLIKSLNTGRCTSPQELSERFEKLFETCLQYNFVPTVEALALCSGFDRTTLWDMETGRRYSGKGYADVVKNAKELIATAEAELARDGTINPTVYIFRAKNYFGMTDKQEVVVTPNTGIPEPTNAQEILKKIPQLDSGEKEV